MKELTKEELKRSNCTPIEDFFDEDIGKEGTPERLAFEASCEVFNLGERLKEERKKAGLTQEQLATKIGTKKTYISRIENGRTDVQLSTLYRIFSGLGKQVSISLR